MAKFTYTGTDVREFPAISVVVNPGDSFDAPQDFSAFNVKPATKSTPTPVGDDNGSSPTLG